MNWRIQFVFFINVSWLTSVCKWGTLICSPCSRVILYFFPWLKRTFLMWHPPSAHINTHAFRIQPQTSRHTHARVHTPTHTIQIISRQTVTQCAHVSLKDTKLSRISKQNSRYYNVPFWYDIHVSVNSFASIQNKFAEQRFVFLPGELRKYFLTVCLYVSLSLPCCTIDLSIQQTTTLWCY